MKIILVNYRYFISGGPERYLFNIKSILEKKGHEVIPFSIKNKRNTPSKYESYFLNPIGQDHEVYFKDYKKSNVKTVIRSFSRMFYSFEAKKKLDHLIKTVSPDLIYVLHYQNKISPSIFDAAARNRIPVIHRISDFGQICANALFYRPIQNDICERCLMGSKLNAIRNKCVHHSYLYSTIKVASIKFQEVINTIGKVQAFVVPSQFTIEKLGVYGIKKEKLNHIPTFFNKGTIKGTPQISYEPFALYSGRIEPEKGLLTLINSFLDTGFNLKIVGFSNTGYDMQLIEYLKDKRHNIEFLGGLPFEEIQKYLSRCLFTIVPSEWYDNLPNTLLESFAFMKCAIATNTGSLKELVIDNKTGLLFKIKDSKDLKDKITYLFNNDSICKTFGQNAFDLLNKEYSEDKHYEKLITLFNEVIANYRHVKK